MSDDWKTPSDRRLIGHMNDASGNSVAISVDRNVVIIRHGGLAIHLRAAERENFQRLFMQAEREAETCPHEAVFSDQSIPCIPCTFPRGHEGPHSYITAADVVTAEIWCGFPGECVNGPIEHLWSDGSCRPLP